MKPFGELVPFETAQEVIEQHPGLLFGRSKSIVTKPGSANARGNRPPPGGVSE